MRSTQICQFALQSRDVTAENIEIGSKVDETVTPALLHRINRFSDTLINGRIYSTIGFSTTSDFHSKVLLKFDQKLLYLKQLPVMSHFALLNGGRHSCTQLIQ